jgi:hypothetical protein
MEVRLWELEEIESNLTVRLEDQEDNPQDLLMCSSSSLAMC